MATPTGILFNDPRAKPTSAAGLAQPGAYYQYYLTQTTTAAPVYKDGALTLPASQTPGTGDTTLAGDGRMIPVYLSPNTIYRTQLYSAIGSLLEDTDPYVVSAVSTLAVGLALYPQTAAEITAVVTPTFYQYPPGDVRRYGADSTGVADSGPAFNTAYAVAIALGNTVGGVIRVPAGQYKITTPVVFSSATVGYLSLIGDGPGTKIINNVVGNPANPCFLVQAKAPFFLFQNFDIYGNSATGAGGNGHGIAFINPDAPGVAGVTTFSPLFVEIQNVSFQNMLGNGKDFSGASIPACGTYHYGVTVHNLDNCNYFNNAMGARALLSEKVHFSECSIDGNNVGVNCLYVDSCQGVEFVNGSLNGAGLGGATDGLVYLTGTSTQSKSFVLSASRAKNGNPFVVNLSGNANCNSRSIDIIDNDIRQLNDPGSHALTAISVGNGNHGVKISGNVFTFVNTITAAVGVDVVQVTAGYGCGGIEIYDNVFDMGSGGTYLACIRFNVGTNKVFGPVVRGNVFGSASVPFTITDGIRLAGNVDNALLQNNYFLPAPAATITNAINLANAANIRWTRVEGNNYDTTNGAITNQLTNSGALNVYRNEGGVFSPGDAISQAALAGGGTITTAGTPLSRVAPAGAVATVILQAGTYRGQICIVENNSAFTVTFDVAGTSNVADGATSPIPALCSRYFAWDANTSRWYRCA